MTNRIRVKDEVFDMDQVMWFGFVQHRDVSDSYMIRFLMNGGEWKVDVMFDTKEQRRLAFDRLLDLFPPFELQAEQVDVHRV